ncbi:MAG: primosomal protein N' [Actinobacteria bacterium]|nr:primosomal protein N' [Actinomycetota bacterium]
MRPIAKVEPLTTARALRGPFDYRLPPELLDSVGVGSVLLVPFARRKVLGVVTALAETSDLPDDKLAEPIRALDAGVPPRLVELGLWVAEQYCSTPARGLSLVTPPGTGTGAGARVQGVRTELVARISADGLHALTDSTTKLNDRQRRALEALLSSGEEGVATADAERLTGADTAALRRLERRGLVSLEPRERRRAPVHESVGALVSRPELTSAQRNALSEISTALAHGHGELLLHGVTGSGKTEVYLGAAESALAAGRGVIVMVPEIALTPQVVTRFSARFGERVAVLHSQLSAGERHDEWLRLSRGQADICVGPRSAVFAPIERLGLLIVDEEHDASYKQEGDPRYDAREVAEQRARLEGALLLSGSATPRAESWSRYRRLTLPERVDGRPLPAVELLDMNGVAGALHPQTSAALARVAADGEKAIVLLNRRGWSNFVSCRDCGHTWICPNCDVTLVLHMARGVVSCHHCGHRERVPDLCPECESSDVARHGVGTERLQNDLEQALGGVTQILRLDADTAAREGVTGVLAAFETADSGVLIGTQMVAKGHDFPDVTLGVVLDADSTLRFPDFRAEERTFALVAQLAGRSGRGPRGGRVLVQTTAPEARPLRFAERHDAAGFVQEELTRRQAFGYPPFSHIVKLQTASPEYAAAMAAAEKLAEAIGTPADGRVLGPTPLFKRKGLERFQLEVKAVDREAVVGSVREAIELVARGAAARGVKFSVDVDPQ